MQNVYVISDTHFGHKRILEFEAAHRPFQIIEEHDRELVDRWNAVVRKDDTVWHLGDVYFGRNGHHILAYLNGTKKLVMGNHDHYPMERYQTYFTKIAGAAEWGGALLTHIPVHDSQKRRYVKNVHGHTHSRKLDDPWYVPVSVEHTGLAPVLLRSLLT